jgi:hypothetical protein
MENAVFLDIMTQFLPHRTHYFFATEPSLLILCNSLGFLGGDIEEYHLLGSYAMWIL